MMHRQFEKIADQCRFPLSSKELVLAVVETPMRKPTAVEITCNHTSNAMMSTNIPVNFQAIMWTAGECRLAFDDPLIIPKLSKKVSSERGTFAELLLAFNPTFGRLREAIPLINEAIPDLDSPVFTKSDRRKGGPESFEIDFFAPFSKQVPKETQMSTVADTDVAMRIKGTVMGRAFVPSKGSTFGDLVNALKCDLARSLYCRFSLHCDGMLVVEDETRDPEALHQLPRRVFAPLTNGIQICEYLFESDEIEDAIDSWQQLLGVNAVKSSVEEGFERIPDMEQLAALGLSAPTEEPENPGGMLKTSSQSSSSSSLNSSSHHRGHHRGRKLSSNLVDHQLPAERTWRSVNFLTISSVLVLLTAVLIAFYYSRSS